MRFAIAVHGTRGDVEPATAVALELMRRGHEVRMAVPPNLVEFTEAAGVPRVVDYGPDSQKQLEAEVFREWFKLRNPVTVFHQGRDYITDGWQEMGDTLREIADGADLILTGTTYQEVAANVAEFYSIPLAALHYFPARASSRGLPVQVPLAVAKPAFAVAEWAHWRLLKPADDRQRRNLGLPDSEVRATRRIVDNGTLEIQAYDRVFFPGLEAEWGGKRPLVGSITLQMPTDTDESVMQWMAAGEPPIYFGFGSMPVEDPADAIRMITEVSADLGERALICSGVLALAEEPTADHVMVVRSANHSVVFPRCRAIVHHGGAGTTAASVRSGVPTLVLWVGADQPVWAGRIKRLGVGTSRRFSSTTPDTLRADLRIALSPRCVAKAREVAAQMTSPAQSLDTTASLLENAASRR
ncbi:MAG: glycosyltransferase [Mycobacterium sp.]|nr:glycosyltransferase [Mycobacterium sp.]